MRTGVPAGLAGGSLVVLGAVLCLWQPATAQTTNHTDAQLIKQALAAAPAPIAKNAAVMVPQPDGTTKELRPAATVSPVSRTIPRPQAPIRCAWMPTA